MVTSSGNMWTIQTLNSVLTLFAARWLPRTIHVRIVSLTLESRKIACFVDTSNSRWILQIKDYARFILNRNSKSRKRLKKCAEERIKEQNYAAWQLELSKPVLDITCLKIGLSISRVQWPNKLKISQVIKIISGLAWIIFISPLYHSKNTPPKWYEIITISYMGS